MGGRGASSSATMGGSSSYVNGYLENNKWLNNLDEESKKNMLDNFKNMPKEQQYYYSLSKKEQNALIDMQTSSQAINEYMSGRNVDISEARKEQLDEQISNVKSAIGKYKQDKPISLYRGVSEAEFNSIKDGGKTESFKSTSTDKSRAEAFAKNQGGYIIEYKAGKGSKIADVNGVSGANENEFLIDSGVKYKNVTQKGDNYLVVTI